MTGADCTSQRREPAWWDGEKAPGGWWVMAAVPQGTQGNRLFRCLCIFCQRWQFVSSSASLGVQAPLQKHEAVLRRCCAAVTENRLLSCRGTVTLMWIYVPSRFLQHFLWDWKTFGRVYTFELPFYLKTLKNFTFAGTSLSGIITF